MRLYAVLGALVMSVALLASVQARPHTWIADLRTGCRVWDLSAAPNESLPWGGATRSSLSVLFYTPPANETAMWSGPCAHGIARGRGVLVLYRDHKASYRYDGVFIDGRPNGRSVSTFANGDRYYGEFRDGMPNGRGIGTFANGDRYEGEFRDNKFNGRGVYTFASGDRYEGDFRDNRFNGTGTYSFVNGLHYQGEFRDGKFVISNASN